MHAEGAYVPASVSIRLTAFGVGNAVSQPLTRSMLGFIDLTSGVLPNLLSHFVELRFWHAWPLCMKTRRAARDPLVPVHSDSLRAILYESPV